MNPISPVVDPLETFLSSLPGWQTQGIDQQSLTQIIQILQDNKLTLFPGYTDHGVRHVLEVLRTTEILISEPVRASRVLHAGDFAVLIMATALHDIAMHLQPSGFLALVSGNAPHQPVEWFARTRGDRPWKDLWEDFFAEARKFDDRKLTALFGGKVTVRRPPSDPARWTQPDCLLAGEFIRRHHARVAHEVALYGFPGIPREVFPGLVPRMGELADLVGVIARSHGLGLRDVIPYLKVRHGSEAAPQGVAATYLMALLRVADYLQLQASRAPVVLLHLRSPLGPVSLDEWAKHGAVSYMGHHDTDRAAVHVQIRPDVTYRTLLQLQELFALLQGELDTSSAVLREIYGSHPIARYNVLELAKTRLTHNAADPEFNASLPYVPERALFRAEGIDLLYQLVKPLYGYEARFGVRELVQNAIDAVRELESLCARFPELEKRVRPVQPRFQAHVRVVLGPDAQGRPRLTIMDKGLGMTPSTVRDYFLTIGVSYRGSDEWEQMFLDEGRSPTVYRSGRFGIGVLAAFLLGDTIEVSTRHCDAVRGVRFRATIPSDLIEMQWADDLPVGTTISVPLNDAACAAYDGLLSGGRHRHEVLDWYTMDWPRVELELNGKTFLQRYRFPLPGQDARPEWSRFETASYPDVQWSFWTPAVVTCNGILVSRLEGSEVLYRNEKHSVRWPAVAVLDPSAHLRIDLQRTQVHWDPELVEALSREVLRNLLAYLLVMGPESPGQDSRSGETPVQFWYPGIVAGAQAYLYTESGFALWDPDVLSATGIRRVVIATEHDTHGFTYPGLGPRTALYSDPEAWIDLLRPATRYPGDPRSAADRALALLMAGTVTRTLPSLAGTPFGGGLVVVREDVRDQMLHNLAASFDWNYRFKGFKPDQVELREGWWLVRTTTSMRPSYDPGAAIAGVESLSGGSAQVALLELEIARSRASRESLLCGLWTETIGSRPIPYDESLRRSELEKAFHDLAPHVEAWEIRRRNEQDQQGAG